MKRGSSGFTLIETMVVVVIVGIMATLIVPRLRRPSPLMKWSVIHDNLNNLLAFARQESIAGQKICRLQFVAHQSALHTIAVQEEKEDPEKSNKKDYEQISSSYFKTKYELSKFVKIVALFHGKKNLLTEKGNEGYCYVIPEGLVQDVSIHLARSYEGRESKMTFKVEPFLGVFKQLEGHVKAEA